MNTSYRGQHTAPDAEYGAPLHDVEAMMPDYYQHPEYYQTGAGDDIDGPSRRAIFRSEGEPDAPVWMWRAVPDDVHTFNPGDWVTTSKPYARQHMEGRYDWHIIARRVKARNLFTERGTASMSGPTGQTGSLSRVNLPDFRTTSRPIGASSWDERRTTCGTSRQAR